MAVIVPYPYQFQYHDTVASAYLLSRSLLQNKNIIWYIYIYSGIVFYLHLSANLLIHPSIHPSLGSPLERYLLENGSSTLWSYDCASGRGESLTPGAEATRFRCGGWGKWVRGKPTRSIMPRNLTGSFLYGFSGGLTWSNPLIYGITQLPGPPKKIGCASWYAEFQWISAMVLTHLVYLNYRLSSLVISHFYGKKTPLV